MSLKAVIFVILMPLAGIIATQVFINSLAIADLKARVRSLESQITPISRPR